MPRRDPYNREVVPVVLRRTAQSGKAWHLWDADPSSSRYHGSFEGFATRRAAVEWLREVNHNDVMRQLRLVSR